MSVKQAGCLALFIGVTVLSCTGGKDAESIARGEALYNQYCSVCHMKEGGGAPPMNPPLTGTSFVKGDTKILVNIMLKGMSGQEVDGEKYHNAMPPMGFMTDQEIADVLTYVRDKFGDESSPVKAEEVKSLR